MNSEIIKRVKLSKYFIETNFLQVLILQGSVILMKERELGKKNQGIYMLLNEVQEFLNIEKDLEKKLRMNILHIAH